MKNVRELCRNLTEYLKQNGLSAMGAWPKEKRLRPGKAVVSVSLRKWESGPPGFQDYLGERYDEAAGQWEELYGKRVELTFGLDLYAATAEEVQAGVDDLGAALGQGGPEGFKLTDFSAGETTYQTEAKRYFCPAQVKFAAWVVALAREDGSFLDFEVRGENRA